MSHHGWGQQGSGAGVKHRGWMSTFLRADAERQVELLGRLAARLELALDKLTDPEALPGEDWTRIARLRLDAYRTLAGLELESAKVRLLAQRVNGKAPMTDEEYEAQLRGLTQDALAMASAEELEAQLARKRALLSAPNGRV